jgi:hypothetical protein
MLAGRAKLFVAVVLVAALAVGGCAPNVDPEVRDCPRLFDTYLVRGVQTETIRRFNSLDMETRYRIYICSHQYTHPPLLGLETYFARDVEAAAFLESKLQQAEHDLTIRDIVDVFVEMSEQNSYDVAGDADLMELLQRKSAQIREPQWRNYTMQRLGEIREPAPTP